MLDVFAFSPIVSGAQAASASYKIIVDVDGTKNDSEGGLSTLFGSSGDPPPLDIPVDVSFTWGEPVSVFVIQQSIVAGSTGVEGVALGGYDLDSTLRWMGITNLQDALGNPVTDFTFHSDTGIDWTQSIPESTTLLLAMLGMGSACCWKRRR